jgi:hypothetical protein
MGIFLLLHQTVPAGGLRRSGDISRPYLQYLQITVIAILRMNRKRHSLFFYEIFSHDSALCNRGQV